MDRDGLQQTAYYAKCIADSMQNRVEGESLEVSQNRKRNFISKMKAYHGGNKYNLSYELFLYIVEQDKFIQAKQCEIERLRRMIDDLEGCEEYTGPIIEDTDSDEEFDFD